MSISFRNAVLSLCTLAVIYYYLLQSGSTTPIDSSRNYSKRIVAVADIHGDLAHLLRILENAKVTDDAGHWNGGETTLVQTGDIVDRGEDTIALYHTMDRLRAEAKGAGGKVVSLLGNHEIMNLLGDLRYVTPEDTASFGGKEARAKAFGAGGWIGETFRSNYSINARVEYFDESYADPELQQLAARGIFSSSASHFTHAGILPTYPPILHSTPPAAVDIVNKIGKSFVNNVLAKEPLTGEQIEFWGRDGPMWARNYALEENEQVVCDLARKATSLLGVRRLFMGHTPNMESILTRCDQIFLIDTGISSAYGGVLSAVEVMYTLERIAGSSGRWKEKEVISALYVETKSHVELARQERILTL